ncbi:hypothetical protein NEMIN01_0457 [Nematocida minor]|uniref:uncharacterized protein n=1 Tax=Nematocida minor TaxID=1912983 RepID=UPI00221E3E9E|nr:uncharacterized protein NEMIN01_0457 [Nematocida minor]KAI5189394.1 hypothetical protein NEMIN01_0457 [Nematocida minor]
MNKENITIMKIVGVAFSAVTIFLTISYFAINMSGPNKLSATDANKAIQSSSTNSQSSSKASKPQDPKTQSANEKEKVNSPKPSTKNLSDNNTGGSTNEKPAASTTQEGANLTVSEEQPEKYEKQKPLVSDTLKTPTEGTKEESKSSLIDGFISWFNAFFNQSPKKESDEGAPLDNSNTAKTEQTIEGLKDNEESIKSSSDYVSVLDKISTE